MMKVESSREQESNLPLISPASVIVCSGYIVMILILILGIMEAKRHSEGVLKYWMDKGVEYPGLDTFVNLQVSRNYSRTDAFTNST